MLGARRNLRAGLLVAPAIVVVAIFLLWPIVELVIKSFMGDDGAFVHYQRIFGVSVYVQVLIRTFIYSAVTALLALLIGYPVAYMLTKARDSVKLLILICVLVPFWTNLLVRTYGWIELLNHNGIINNLLMSMGIISGPLDLIYNSTGVIVSLTHVMLPYMILPVYAVMRRTDPRLNHAARSLGAGPIYTFIKIYFPATFPGVMAGFLLIFAMCLGFFVIPALVGGGEATMIAQLIEFNINGALNWGMASALSACLLVVTLVVYWIGDRWFNLGSIWGFNT